jgi:tRNA 2-selenouridine synthase
LQNITEEYGILPREKLEESILKIAKRLGGLETKTALQYLEENNIEACFTILLHYYDKYYQKGLEKRDAEKCTIIKVAAKDIAAIFQ